MLWFNSSTILRHSFTNLSVRWGLDNADATDADTTDTADANVIQATSFYWGVDDACKCNTSNISLLVCKRHKTKDSCNSMIITNDLNIDCEGINKLLFILNETNDKFDWRCENQWYNDDTA